MMNSILELCPYGVEVEIQVEPTLPGNTILCKNMIGTEYIVSSDISERLHKDILPSPHK